MVGMAQLASAPDCGSGGRGFESHYPPDRESRKTNGLRDFQLKGLCIFINLLVQQLPEKESHF